MKDLEYETFKINDANDEKSRKENYKKLIGVVNKWLQKKQNVTFVNIELEYNEFMPRIRGTEYIDKVI